MSLLDPVNTLSYHASRGLCLHRDMSAAPCDAVAQSVKTMLNTSSPLASPELSALAFYFRNHGKAVLGQTYHSLEPLPKEDMLFLEAYHRTANKMAIRAFYYLLLICVRESRHVQSNIGLRQDIANNFGKACADFNASIDSCGSSGAYMRFLKAPPQANIGAFCRSLQHIFYNGHFSSGFGGVPWGVVADCLVSFVTGESSAEIMVDTVWTLCHNNGPIFNKGMLYEEHTGTLVRILDVQRSGQIAEACLSDNEIAQFVDGQLLNAIEEFSVRHPGNFGSYVDWFAVEARGAVHTYPAEKAVQAKLYGLSEKQIALMNEVQKAKLADAQAKAEIAKNFSKYNFEYWPGKTVPILIKPKARAA